MNGNGAPPGNNQRDHDLHVRDFLNLVLRNVWLILVVAGTVIAVTVWYNWTTPPVFEARATIHVDQERSAVMPELDFLTSVLRGGDVETEMALLRARHIAEATVDSLALQVRLVKPQGIARDSLFDVASANPITENESYTLTLRDGAYEVEDSEGQSVTRVAPGEATLFNGVRIVISSDPPGGLREVIELRVHDRFEAVQDLSERLSVGRPYRDADLIAVGYQGTDPALVQEIPNAIAHNYIAQRTEAKKTEAVSMVAFLNDQIATYSAELTAAEDAVEAFERGQQVVNLEAESAQNVARLVTMQAQRDDYEADLQTLTGILALIDSTEAAGGHSPDGPSPFQRLASFPTFLENQAVTELLTDLNRTTNELSAMLEVRERTHPDVIAYERQIEQNEDQLYQLARSYQQNLETSIVSLDQRLVEFGAELQRIPQKEVQQQRLERRKTTLETLYNQLQTRLKEAEIAQAVEPGDVRVSDLAIYPRDPIRPRKMRSLVLSILFGLTLGLGVAGARDYLDETVHTREDLGRATGLPVLGLIPRIRPANGNGTHAPGRRSGADRLITRFDAKSAASEAYRTFRTNITFLNLEKPAQVLVFTSPGPAEGKSTSAANLAITLAQQGTPTVLVDCDLRRGIVHRLFSADKEPGVTNVLMGDCQIDDAIHVVPLEDDATLHFLGTGTLPPNPSELLGSKPMRELVAALRDRYEAIVIDSPPLNVVTDAAVLGTVADGVILIARAGATARASLRFAKDQLDTVSARVSGAVLNDVNLSGRDRYYGSGAGYRYYRSYYSADD